MRTFGILQVVSFLALTLLLSRTPQLIAQAESDPASTERIITPHAFQGSDVQRINQAIAYAAPRRLKVVIPRINETQDDETDIWMLDSAILVRENTFLELNNCHIRLSDQCRDNMIRSANCGLDITEVEQIRNISIIGVGDVLLEGADHPRATGDSAKALGERTYGTDAGVEGVSQTGDWRNIGILLAHIERFSIQNLRIKDSHCWAVSLERCGYGIVSDLHFDSQGSKTIDGVRETILNQDGLDLRQGCHDINISRITGSTGDDLIAMTAITKDGSTAGSDTLTMVTPANCGPDGSDDIHNIFIHQIAGHSNGRHHVVRLLNASGLRIYNIFLDGLIDTSPSGAPCKATIKIGDSNPTWGGVTPLGDTSRIFISNISGASSHTILIAGSLTDSIISHVVPRLSGSAPITFESGIEYVENVQF
jgi:hypothetical protein